MILQFIKNIFQKQDKDNSKSETKGEIDFDRINFKEFIYLESAYNHQEIIIRRSLESNRVKLGELLETFKIHYDSILSMAIMQRLDEFNDTTEQKVFTDKSQIWNYDIFSTILKDKTDEGYYTHGMFYETTFVVQTNERNTIINFTSLGGNDNYKYMRATILSPDNATMDDCYSLKTENSPFVISTILSNCEEINEKDVERYKEVEKNVEKKRNNQEKYDDIETEFINGRFEFRGPHYIDYGKWLFAQNRYYDAYTILLRAFNYFKPQLDNHIDDLTNTFYEVSNIIGCCLSKLNRENEAVFFYQKGIPGLLSKTSSYLALSYAKLGDPRALEIMSDLKKADCKSYWEEESSNKEVEKTNNDIIAQLKSYKTVFDTNLKISPKYDPKITIGFALKTLIGIDKTNITPDMFVYDLENNSFLSRIEDINSIYDFILNTEEAKNKVFVLSCTHVYYKTNDLEDKSILCHNAPIVISTHSIKGKKSDAIIRVDISQCNYSNNDDKLDFVRMNIPFNVSFVLGEYKENVFTSKHNDLLDSIHKSIDLMNKNRFFECYKLSKWIFDCASNSLKDTDGLHYVSKDDTLWKIFFESSYRVGFCLMELGCFFSSAYFLELSTYNYSYKNIQEYINFLSNTKDPSALDIIVDTIEKSPKPTSDKIEDIEAWNYHIAFLKRRQAYILIDKGRYDEAKELLKVMLNNPYSDAFAREELNYINKILSQSLNGNK